MLILRLDPPPKKNPEFVEIEGWKKCKTLVFSLSKQTINIFMIYFIGNQVPHD